MSRKSVKVAVTGAAGQIGYSLLPRLASGEIFGMDTKISLHLLEITPALPMLEGVVMEMNDSAFPLLENIVVTDDPNVAFDGVNWAMLVGSKPRGKGMLRGDLIRENGPIFVGQGQALQRGASDMRVIVVGNPANTNALIAMNNCPGVPNDRFAALTHLDENRAYSQIATKAGVTVNDISKITIWGNHSATQYPDVSHALINGKSVFDVIDDHDWLRGDFISTVQKRGAAIIQARGKSSAASAANAALNHIQAFEVATPADNWFSSGVASDGSYGIDKGLMFSLPIRSDGKGGWSVVQGLEIDAFSQEKINATLEELRNEKAMVAELLA